MGRIEGACSAVSDDMLDVIEDLRARHRAVVQLILFTDQQATLYLQTYLTVSLAAGTAAATALSGVGPVPTSVGYGLASATLVLLAGAFFCLGAAASGAINLPGRGADFWR